MSVAAPPGVVSEVLLTEQQIQERVRALGAAISSDYAGLDPILVGVLRGVVLFMADLMRAITIPIAVDFLAINNYGAQQQPGAVRILKDLEESVAGRHVLFVEDMVDTGLTLNYLLPRPARAPAGQPAGLYDVQQTAPAADQPAARLRRLYPARSLRGRLRA